NLGEREPFLFAEDLEDRLQRAVAARAVQPQLVAEAALLRETSVGGEQRGERADRVSAAGAAVLAPRRELVGERAHVRGPSRGERVHRSRVVVRLLRILLRGGRRRCSGGEAPG